MKKTEGCSHTVVVKQLEAYLEWLKARRYKARSIRGMSNCINIFLVWLQERGIENPQDVTTAMLEEYRHHLVSKNLAATSVRDYLRHVKKFFNYLEDRQVLFINPARDLQMPEVKKKLQPVPNEDDIKKLLAQPDISGHSGIKDRAIIEVAYSTGLRLEELVSLNVYDPDLKNGVVKVMGKGSKERVVPLGRQSIFWLKKYITDVRPGLLHQNPDELALWLGARQGKRIHPIIVERMIKNYAELAGIKTRVTPHGLRRACATHMLRAGAHPVQIQMLLGHASLETLSQYLKVTITDMRHMHERSKPGR